VATDSAVVEAYVAGIAGWLGGAVWNVNGTLTSRRRGDDIHHLAALHGLERHPRAPRPELLLVAEATDGLGGERGTSML
jgi:hypothetical protein